jgi:OOP family OmpA-OmpF porin
MKKQSMLITCLTTGLTLASAGIAHQAIAKDAGFSVTPGIGFYKFDDDLDLEDEGFASLGLQYQFTDRFAVEAAYGASDTENKYSIGAPDLDWSYAHIDALYYFNPGQKLRPYLAFGAGEGELKLNSVSEDETLLNIGGGIKYAFGNALGVRADLRAVNSQDNETTSGLATVALSYLFGAGSESPNTAPDFEISQAETLDSDEDGIADASDQCASTPIGISVDTSGCALDTDLDGIADYQDQCTETPDGISVDNLGCPQDLDKDGIADYQDRCLNTESGALIDQQGCAVRLSEIAPNISDLVFEVGSAQMRQSYYNDIESLATFMKRYNNTVAVLEGHTDSVGDAQLNEKLSKQRAQAVQQVLVEQFNIDPSRIKVVGYGESRPIATNTTKEGRAKNRRVNTKIETIQ